jgi:nitroimidazol reductase NimA-like FMN-containing flavoprotein (pyridoxamine 5'-phosphate oxidase superfamily)
MTHRLTDDPAFIDKVLTEAEVGHVAFGDGEIPYLVPLLFVQVDGRLYVHSATKGHKMDLVRRENENRLGFVAYVIDRWEYPPKACEIAVRYRSVQGTGTAREVTDSATVVRALNALAQKYAGDRPFEPASTADLKGVTVVEIELESVVGKENF